MCNVNYLIELRRFHTFAARTGLPASAQLLWYKLIEIMNETARGADWPDGFLRIDNPYLLSYFPMSATALADARRTLCEYGLLEYIPGEKKRTPPAYRLHYFSVSDREIALEEAHHRRMSADYRTDSTADYHADCAHFRDNADCSADSTADSPTDCPEIRDNPSALSDDSADCTSDCTADCPTDCTTDCTTDCHADSPEFRDTNRNYTETYTETETGNQTGEPSDEEKNTSAFFAGYAGACADTGAGAREDAVRQSARLTSKVVLHQAFTDEQLNRVMAVYSQYPFEKGLIIQAIVKTAEANPTNAVNYLLQLLTDWGSAGVRTVADMEEYLYARDAALGNALLRTKEEGRELLSAFRARHGAA